MTTGLIEGVISPPRERAVVAVAMATNVLVPLNSTMIAVALPDLVSDLGASVTAGGWLVTGYLIVMAVLQPFTGRLGDHVDRRTLLLGGLVCFGAASVAAGIAPTMPLLLSARLCQAVAGAFLMPTTQALVRTMIPVARRARRVGTVGSATGLAAAVGPALGGGLVELGGWRTIFVANAPAVALALVFAAALGRVPRVEASPHDEAAPHPLAILGRVAFLAPTLATGLSNLAMYTTLLAVPILLARQGGVGPGGAGLVVSALTAGLAIVGPLGGRMADRFGRRRPATVGLSATALALVVLALTAGVVPVGLLVVVLGIAGLGLGASYPSLQTAALESVGPDQAGAAAGLYSGGRYLGSIIGSALLAQLVARSATDLRPVFILALAGGTLSAVAASRVTPWPPSNWRQ